MTFFKSNEDLSLQIFSKCEPALA